MKLDQLRQDSVDYPTALTTYLEGTAPTCLTVSGNVVLLQSAPVALLCSAQCPGHLILQAYDLAERLRSAALPVTGGFHTPLERECLRLLLRGPGPVVICLARGLEGMRLPLGYRRPLAEGRLLLISPFAGAERRVTAELAHVRNRVVAALAGRIVVAYAAPGGKTEALCREIAVWGKPLFTLASPSNAHLVALGAQPLTPDTAALVLSVKQDTSCSIPPQQSGN